MNKWLIIIWLITASKIISAQDFKISRINESEFPNISFQLEISGGSEKSIEGFALEEYSNPIEYTATPDDATGTQLSRTYIFLVENSYYFHRNKIFPELITSLKQVNNNIKEGDRVNVLFFGGKLQPTVKYVSIEPTADTHRLNSMVDCYFKSESDSTCIDNPLYPSIEEAAEYALSLPSQNSVKFLFVIARGLNLCNILTFSPNFVESMRKSNLYINVVMFKTETPNARRELADLCESSGGSFVTFEKGQLEQTLMQLDEKNSKTPPKITNHCYKISFKTSQNGTNNFVKARFNGSENVVEFSNPNKTGIFGRHPSTAVAGIMFAVLAVVLIIYAIVRNKVIKKIDDATKLKMREIQIQNKRLKREIEKYRKHPVSVSQSFDDFNSAENLVAGGQQTPKLICANDGENTSYDLNKLVMSIGRADDNDIVIPNRTVSSHHATLSFEGGVFYISDNDSTNGIFVNDIKITKSKVHNDDIIRIGAVFAKLKY
ncbi:MAG: FHA domain-containing protein [Bacteroidales bacterium]|nr:FHA domain-containing protein [Bacteroidales bacterium]